MSNVSFTYHIIWRTKKSENTINEVHERDLYAYIHGICKAKKCTLYRINSMPDHMHLCLEISPTIAISDFVKLIKQESSKWMKQHKDWFPKFNSWGNGYAGFSYSKKERDKIIAYVKHQKEHHHKKSFQEELEELVKEFGIDAQYFISKD
ncbi:MAG: IS200/IS605 family transposase [Bacteroidales bacterium]|nr:IS200/IS605 family transposase [Bacteroidales bacterium]